MSGFSFLVPTTKQCNIHLSYMYRGFIPDRRKRFPVHSIRAVRSFHLAFCLMVTGSECISDVKLHLVSKERGTKPPHHIRLLGLVFLMKRRNDLTLIFTQHRVFFERGEYRRADEVVDRGVAVRRAVPL